MSDQNTRETFDWHYFLRHIAIIAVPVALQNLLTTTGSMVGRYDDVSIAGRADSGSGRVMRPIFQFDVCGLLGFCGRRHVVFRTVLGCKK